MKGLQILDSDQDTLWPEQEQGPDLSILKPASSAEEVRSTLGLIQETPEQAAEHHKLAKITGLPVSFVRDDPDPVRKLAERPDVFNLASSWPNTTEYFKQIDSAAISRRDIEPLKAIEDWIKLNRESWERTKASFSALTKDRTSFLGKSSASLDIGKEVVTGGKLGAAAMDKALRGDTAFGDALEKEIAQFEASRTAPVETEGAVDYSVQSALQMLPLMLQTTYEGLGTGSLGLATGAAIGSLAPGVGTALGGTTGLLVTSRAGAAKAMFEMEGGNAFLEFRQIKDERGNPLDPQIAAAAAGLVGAVNASLEYIGFSSVGKFLIPGARKAMAVALNGRIKQMLSTEVGKKAFAGLAKRYVTMVGTESFTEMAQEGMTILGGEAAKGLDTATGGGKFEGAELWSSLSRIFESGQAGAGAAAVIGGAGIVNRAAVHSATTGLRDAARAKEFRQLVAEAAEYVEATETKQLSADHMERFLDMQGMGDELFIDGEALHQIAQDDTGREVLSKLGIASEFVEQQREAGQSVGFKASAALSRLSYEEQALIGDHVKPAPGAMSKAEADAFNPEADVREAEEITLDLAAQENAYREELRRYRNEVAEVEGGEYAEHLTSIVDAFATRMGIEGVDKVAFAKKLGVKNLTSVRKVRMAAERAEFTQEGDRDISSENFKSWFGSSQVVDEAGSPVTVYAGHGNVAMFGEAFNVKKATAGGFYGTVDPELASSYAVGKLGNKEIYENGDEYRIQAKNGKYSKKIQQIVLDQEQTAKIDEIIKEGYEDESGVEGDFTWLVDMPPWIENSKKYDVDARRMSYTGGAHNLWNIWKYAEMMGYTIAYDRDAPAGTPLFLKQRQNRFEDLLDHLGIGWQSAHKSVPGVMPGYVNISNPLDTSKPFPPELLQALKQAAKGEKRRSDQQVSDTHWTRDYPLRNWIEDIEKWLATGEETYWATQVPTKAKKILQDFGYDGIKDTGGKAGGKKHTVYIWFEPTQFKSKFNRGTWDPNEANTLYDSFRPPKREKSTGRYVGAPDWVGSSPGKLAALRKKLKQLALEGETGRYWYERSSEAILRLAGGDIAEAEKIVALIAIYSPNATVPANTTMALTAYYQWKNGSPIKAGMGAADKKATELLIDGVMWSGVKTNSFYQNLMVEIDPSKLDPGVATMDMWMAIAFDYGYKTLDQGPKYKFSQNEIVRLADELGWAPHQVQAAIWTAMKARIDPIRNELKAKELKKGIGEEYDKDGKTLYRVKPDKRYDHFRLAHKMGMAYKVTKQDTTTAKFDFSNALEERMAQMSWEATPSTSVDDVAFIHAAPTELKFKYLEGVQKILTGENGQDIIAELIGLASPPTINGFSAWAGSIGAGAQDFISVPLSGEGKNRAVKADAAAMLDLYAAVRGYVLRQDAVVWHVPIYDAAKGSRNGFEIRSLRPISESEMKQLYGAIHKEFGTWELAPGYIENGLRILNFVEGLENKNFQKRMEKVLKSMPADFGGGNLVSASYRSDGSYISNNWEENPNGESYEDRVNARRPDILGRVKDVRARIEAFNKRFEEEANTLFQSDGQSGGGLRADRLQVNSRYGTAVEGGEQIRGVHYSQGPKDSLSGEFYGTGMKGAERKRLDQSEDPRIKKRIHFYVDTGSGITPESAVGRDTHAVDLSNIYNMKADPLGLQKKAAAKAKYYENPFNVFEGLVIDAGFDGYYHPDAQTTQGVAVLLGDHDVKVDHLGKHDALLEDQNTLFHGAKTYFQSILGFYSAVEKAIVDMDFKAMPAKDLVARIKKTPGVKAEELEYLGLIEWLEGEEGEVSKEQVLEFVKKGGVQLEEVQKGGPFSKTPAEWRRYFVENGYMDEAESSAMTDEEILQMVEDEYDRGNAEDVTAKYEKYTLPGGENYREVLLTLPTETEKHIASWSVYLPDGTGLMGTVNEKKARAKAEEVGGYVKPIYQERPVEKEKAYKSGHYDEPNILAHFRLNDRIDLEGRRTLFIEEIQSDWHQEGRKKGYREDPVTAKDISVTEIPFSAVQAGELFAIHEDEVVEFRKKKGIPFDAPLLAATLVGKKEPFSITWAYTNKEEFVQKTLDEIDLSQSAAFDSSLAAEQRRRAKGAPNAPFKKSWPLLAFKRILRMAAEEDYDAVAWTPGQAQADRYDLSKHVNSVYWSPNYYVDGGRLTAIGNNGLTILDEGTTEDKIENFIGKEAAKKLLESEPEETQDGTEYSLIGEDLKVGGEGMKAFYDKMLPSEIGKYVKKLDKDAKVGTDSVVTELKPTYSVYADGELVKKVYRRDEAEYIARQLGGDEGVKIVENTKQKTKEVWSLPLTDKLKAKVLEGQTLFQDKEEIVRGSVPLSNDSHIVSVFQDKRMDTILHETGHIFLKELDALVRSGNASERMQKDFNTILKWFGIDSIDRMTREHHEQFADGLRDYIGEGRAPSQELAAAFSRFKQWLMQLFGRALQLNVRTTPEVRAVFQRLFTSRSETISAASEHGIAPWSDALLDALGVLPQDRKYLSRLYQEALVEAEDLMMHDRNFQARNRKAKWEKEAEREVNEDPVQAALQGAKRLKLNSQQIGNKAYRNILTEKGVVKERGEDINTAAIMYGFNSGAELVEALVGANTREEQKQLLIDRKQQEHDAQFRPEEYIAQTKAYEQVLQIRGRYLSRAAGNPTQASPVKTLKIAAEMHFRKLTLETALRTDWFLGAIKRHTHAEKQALQKGDFAAASKHNEQVRLNHEMARLAANLRKRRDIMLRKARAIGSKDPGKIKSGFRDGLYDLINRFEMRGKGKYLDVEPGFRLETILEGVSAGNKEEVRQGFYASPQLLGMMMPLNKLNVEQFMELQDLMKYLEIHGRPDEEKLLQDGRKVIDVQSAMAAEAEKHLPKRRNPEQLGKFKRSISDAWDGYWARSDSMNFTMTALGGFQSVGKNAKFSLNENEVTQRLSDAHNRKSERVRHYTALLDPHYRQILSTILKLKKEYGAFMQGEDLPPTPVILQKDGTKSWTPQMIFALALHYGNESNRSRIQTGFPDLTDAHLKQLFDLLSEADWDAVQGIWDINDQIFEEVNEVHNRVNGYRVKKIPAAPFSVVTKQADGTVIKKQIRGGYAPVRYDSGLMHRVANAGANRMNEFYEQEDLLARHESKFMTPNINSKFTKARVAKTPYPLLLNLDMIGDHVMDALHYVVYEEVVRDVNNLFKGMDFHRAVVERMGPAVLTNLKEQLAFIANPRKQTVDPQLEGWLGRLRAGTTAWMLAYNASVAAKQGLSAFAAAQYIGNRGLAAAYIKHGLNIPEIKNNILFMLNNSEYMRSRTQSFDQEFRKIFNNLDFNGVLNPSDLKDLRNLIGVLGLPTGKSVKIGSRVYSWTDIADIGFFPIKAVDMATVMPIWTEAYQQKMQESNDQEAAVKYADNVIRSTQPSAQGIDMTKWQRDGGVASLLSMFGTFTVGKYQQRIRLNWRMMKAGKMSKGQYAQTVLLEQIVPAVAAQVIVTLMKGDSLEDDEDKLLFALRVLGMIITMPFPVLGMLFPFGNFLFDLPVLSPVQQVQRTAYKAGKDVYEGNWGDAAKDFAMAAGHAWSIANRVPLTRVIQRVDKLTED